MSRRTSFLLWICGAVIVATLGVNLAWTRTERVAIEAKLASLGREIQRAEARLQTAKHAADRLAERVDAQEQHPLAEPSLTPEEQRHAALRRALSENLAQHTGDALPPPAEPFGPNYTAEHVADPTFAALYRAWWRPRMETDYNPLFVALPVPSETKSRLADLLMEKQLARMDLLAATGANRWGPANPPTKSQSEEVNRAQEAGRKIRHPDSQRARRNGLRPVRKISAHRAAAGRDARHATQLHRRTLDHTQQAQLLELASQPDFVTKSLTVLTPSQAEIIQESQRERAALRPRR